VGHIDYAMLVKLYGAAPESFKGRYSPADCIGARKTRIEGDPNPKQVSTSYAKRSNLTTSGLAQSEDSLIGRSGSLHWA
jgi:hypothetical protein